MKKYIVVLTCFITLNCTKNSNNNVGISICIASNKILNSDWEIQPLTLSSSENTFYIQIGEEICEISDELISYRNIKTGAVTFKNSKQEIFSSQTITDRALYLYGNDVVRFDFHTKSFKKVFIKDGFLSHLNVMPNEKLYAIRNKLLVSEDSYLVYLNMEQKMLDTILNISEFGIDNTGHGDQFIAWSNEEIEYGLLSIESNIINKYEYELVLVNLLDGTIMSQIKLSWKPKFEYLYDDRYIKMKNGNIDYLFDAFENKFIFERNSKIEKSKIIAFENYIAYEYEGSIELINMLNNDIIWSINKSVSNYSLLSLNKKGVYLSDNFKIALNKYDECIEEIGKIDRENLNVLFLNESTILFNTLTDKTIKYSY